LQGKQKYLPFIVQNFTVRYESTNIRLELRMKSFFKLR